MIQKLIIYEKLLSLNVYRNMHHYKLNKLKSYWTDLILIETIKQKIKPIKKCKINFIFHWKDNRKRDADNYSATIKFIMDGLVKSKILIDDNFDYVESITILKGKLNKESVEIEIIEV